MLLLFHILVATYVHYRQLVNQEFHAMTQDLETAEGLLYETSDNRLLLNENYFNRPQMRSRFDRLLEVISPDGQILFKNARLDGTVIGGGAHTERGQRYLQRASSDLERWPSRPGREPLSSNGWQTHHSPRGL